MRKLIMVLLVLYPLALSSAGEKSSPTLRIAADVAAEVRMQMRAFESAWNRGDVASVTAQYHPSMEIVYGAEYWDYVREVSSIEGEMNRKDRAAYKVDINSVRALGEDYAVANGRFHLFYKDGTEKSGLFTVIYMRSGSEWKMIYAHS